MTKINVNAILALDDERREINALNLEECEFTYNGETVQISTAVLRHWEFLESE